MYRQDGARLMVSSGGVSAVVCGVAGLLCIGSVFQGHDRSDAAAVRVAIPAAPAPVAVVMAPSPAALTPDVDTSLPTGAIAPASALHKPNPAAYAEAAEAGSSPVVTGAEAINYLAGNTLRREGPGDALHSTYFAARGVMGDGDERGFTARRWDRERPELCAPGPDGAPQCRSVSILLDGRYEFPGARLGTVTLGPAGGAGPVTAALIKGNAIHVPEHIPFIDSDVDVAGTAEPRPARGGEPFDGFVDHAAASVGDGDASGRRIVYYARDNRRLELRQIQSDGGKAVEVTVGHWRTSKSTLCQTRVVGAGAQDCFKVEPVTGGAVRLVPVGKAGTGQTVTALPETGSRLVAQD